MKPIRFAHVAFDTVAIDRLTNVSTRRESYLKGDVSGGFIPADKPIDDADRPNRNRLDVRPRAIKESTDQSFSFEPKR